jgi:hypothetical protein
MDILDRINSLPSCLKKHIYREYVLPEIIRSKLLLWKLNTRSVLNKNIYLTKTINII